MEINKLEIATDAMEEGLEKAWIAFLAAGGDSSMKSRTNFFVEFRKKFLLSLTNSGNERKKEE